ncbi:DUF4389 domain-containing protein [Parvicella tangerina]|uniref:DUF4389 domain-containing protein n=1 Tax=Parvicella tangerina TaxID=2829795 RepID=A0A916JNZ7_9FLAO|nr:DUF4389 domain-containing protein [Parvicella tangerina]CAG5085432.1 hypothetical protein CRYO30217_02758 [Parvicella tangerina]
MHFKISHQEKYSQGELILRTLFGWIYIAIPHMFLMYFLAIGLMVVRFITFWAILFTGKWPKGMFDYQVKFQRYQLRVNARLLNLADGYPAFGLNGTDTNTDFNIAYPEEVSRGRLIVRTLFGAFLIIPHIFILYFRFIGMFIVNFLAFFAILFTGKYPKGMFNFVVGTIRWATRVGCYLMFYTDDYPPFTGKELPEESGQEGSMKDSDPNLLDDTI